MLSVKQGGIYTIPWVFIITGPRIEPRSPGQLADTLRKIRKKSDSMKMYRDKKKNTRSSKDYFI